MCTYVWTYRDHADVMEMDHILIPLSHYRAWKEISFLKTMFKIESNFEEPVSLCAGGGSSSGSQHSPGGYLPHVGHQNQPQTPTPSSTPVSDMSPQPPHGMSGSPPVVSWDMKPTAPAHHPAAHHPHHHTHPGYMPQYSWYQADAANQGLLT